MWHVWLWHLISVWTVPRTHLHHELGRVGAERIDRDLGLIQESEAGHIWPEHTRHDPAHGREREHHAEADELAPVPATACVCVCVGGLWSVG